MLWEEACRWFSKIWSLIRPVPPPKPDPPLLAELLQLQEHIACLENQFNNVDRGMVEYVIFKLNAAECLLSTLRQAARREHLTAWADALHPVVR